MTEGVSGTVGTTNRVGALGWLGTAAARNRHPATKRIIRLLPDHSAPARDAATGLCISTAPGESGELIFAMPNAEYKGYTDEKANRDKVLRSVGVKDDAFFRTGDLVRYDDEGFMYYVDRIGDTFRWKGENTSTNEVAHVLLTASTATPGKGETKLFSEVNVYGVKVFEHGGRAGMACVVPTPGVGFQERLADGRVGLTERVLVPLAAVVSASLPHFARPLFLRVSEAVEVTDTLKHRKVGLVADGFEPSKCGKDVLYFFNGKSYDIVTADLLDRIQKGIVRV